MVKPQQEMFENLLRGKLLDTGYWILDKSIHNGLSSNNGASSSTQYLESGIQYRQGSNTYATNLLFYIGNNMVCNCITR